MMIRVKFWEYWIKNKVEKVSPKRNRSWTAILLTSLSFELGLGIFIKVVDMNFIFH